MSAVSRVRKYIERRVKRHRDKSQATRFLSDNPELAETIRKVRDEQLTFLDLTALTGLADAVKAIERRGLSGAVLEAGTALGGSAVVLAAAKAPDRRMLAYDTFGLIPPPSANDGADVHERYAVIASGKSEGIGGEKYYGYRDDLLGEVRASFARFGLPSESNSVEFVQGVYQESMTIDFPVALAHVDCDWYESVMTCLERIAPHVVQGGRFVIDDYDAWSGARRAVDDFFKDRPDWQFTNQFGRLHIVRELDRSGPIVD